MEHRAMPPDCEAGYSAVSGRIQWWNRGEKSADIKILFVHKHSGLASRLHAVFALSSIAKSSA
jgi:hypothetical protein